MSRTVAGFQSLAPSGPRVRPAIGLDLHALIDRFDRLLAEHEPLVSRSGAAHSAQEDGDTPTNEATTIRVLLCMSFLSDPCQPRISCRLPLAPIQAAVRREDC